ncbi:MAG: hypothetical protein ACN6PJ_28380 [Achromobacter sp.]|uniref:hypothetical protein n=1 Tax=Achromobacter sp. TaxID=134375 RepID=UPI003D01B0BC
MAVENTTNIAGLDDTLPAGTDTKSEGDNHLRLLKTVLKHVFAGFPGEVLLAAAEAQGATVNDYVLTVAPAPTAYAANTAVVFRANHANTGAATLKVGSLAAKSLVNPEGTPLRANAITATTWVLAIYDGTSFRLMGGGNSQAIYDYANQLAFQAALPNQAGNDRKFLRTDGSNASWQDALPVYAPGNEPLTDIGDILVSGLGIKRFVYGLYTLSELPTKYRQGGKLTHTTNTVTAAAGCWRDVGDELDIVLATSMTKTLQTSGAWAAGDNANGIFTGVRANSTWYHLFVIRNDATGAVDLGFDTSVTAANRPAGWTAYRRLGAVFTTATGNIFSFVNFGRRFTYNSPASDLVNAGLGNLNQTAITVTVPVGIQTLALLIASVLPPSAATVSVGISSPGLVSTTSSLLATGGNASIAEVSRVTSTTRGIAIQANINTFASGLYIFTTGYEDFLDD